MQLVMFAVLIVIMKFGSQAVKRLSMHLPFVLCAAELILMTLWVSGRLSDYTEGMHRRDLDRMVVL